MIGQTTEYRADLQRVGAAVNPTLTLLDLLTKQPHWHDTLTRVKRENRLGFRSSKTLEDFLLVFKHRYLDEHPPFPNWALLCRAISLLPHRGAIQLLLPYLLASDCLLRKYVVKECNAMLEEEGAPPVSVADILRFLSGEAKEHRELVRWSDKTRIRWAWRCLATLKTFGIVTGTPPRVSRPILLPDTFAFFLLGLVENGMSQYDSIEHPLWGLYLLENEQKKELLNECASNGWIYYDEAGPIKQLIARYSSLEAWLDAGVARTSV